MPKIRANNVELNYEMDGQGYPAVFIHGGFGGPGSTIMPGPKAVAASIPKDKIKIVTYDRRCAGLSEYDLGWYTLEDIATDTRELMRNLGFDRFVVIGSSMGGMVAVQYALSFPETVTALALMNTGPDIMGMTPWGRTYIETVERVKATSDEAEFERAKEQIRNPAAPSPAFGTPENRKQIEQNHLDYVAKLKGVPDDELKTLHAGSLRNAAAFIDCGLEPRLTELSMQTLIVHGNADTVVPYECGLQLTQGIPHAEFHEIDGANHGILAYPEAQNVLRNWLTGLNPD